MLDFNRTIAPADHMMTADEASYFRTTESALTCIQAGLQNAKRTPESIKSVLDFGSGYGRVYRALAAAFPKAKLTACDLMEPAARFCAETFGGDWASSHEDLGRISLPRKYDLIWLGSVFTHLPSYRWILLLDFLAKNTEPGGVVVFTCHGKTAIEHIEKVLLKKNPKMIDGQRFVKMKRALPFTGFEFIANQPAAIKHQNDRGIAVTQGEYGFSFTTEWWARRVIEKMAEWELARYAAPGWAGNHDAVTLVRKTA